ncbi:MAG TPA: DMT family transporter [Candidatus Aphodoplasma excrementigallinarum]|uniref:DMT family transporter n=1 Tax=Candidatus Aphodoplasma excrementigallinarum TaxID=2840673 RepID=A0A9D1SZG0_9FIRM|nr:DMT family transporter [Candidatus Aphodoplasma excrementigallinarum]
MRKSTANLLLLLIAVFWGSGFIVVKVCLDLGVSAGLVNVFRGGVFTALSLLFFGRHILKMNRKDLLVGLAAGACNFGGMILQTVGVQYTTPSNNAFFTSTYVVMVPFLAWFMAGKKPAGRNFLSVAVCVAGMVVLSGILQSGLRFNIGDVYSLLSAWLDAITIVYLGYRTNEIHFSAVAFMLGAVQTAGSLIYCFITGSFAAPGTDWPLAIWPLFYLGAVCSFGAQTIQVAAQRHTSATSAGLIMMLEGFFGSVISVLFGFEGLTVQLLIGGMLIMLSIVLAEADIPAMAARLRRRRVPQNR